MQIELVQAFLPNRSFSLLDIVADMIGAVFGVIVVEILKRIYYGKRQSQFLSVKPAVISRQSGWANAHNVGLGIVLSSLASKR